jgi:hypothetical protein
MNVQNQSTTVEVSMSSQASTRYVLQVAPDCCGVLSPYVRLNGESWRVSEDGTLPMISAEAEAAMENSVELAAYGTAFVVYSGAKAAACS